MSNKLVSMQIIRTILQQLQKGASGRHIARQLHISRNTVKQYTERFAASGYSLELLQQLDDEDLSAIVYAEAKQLQPDARLTDFKGRMDYFLSELTRPGVTRLLLWEEYKKAYPEGYEYSKFCELMGQQKAILGATMHFEYHPGEIMMVDFAGDPMGYVNRESGEMVFCPVLICVLPYSDYCYVEALHNASLPLVVRALNGCLAYFGGVPQSAKYDNMRQVVTRTCRYEPLFTEMMQQWALHNNITLLAARVAKPRDKAPVENEVKIAYRRIYAPLRDKVFFSLEELNLAIRQQLELHHHRLFQKRSYSRHDRFTQEEKEVLQPLPFDQYVMKHSAQAKVQKNYHITLGEDWHHYSVPFNYIGKSVKAVYDSDTVEVYYEHKRIAIHKRGYKKHGYSTSKDHMPEGHQRYFEQRGWDGDYFLEQARKTGPNTHEYIKKVLQGKHFTEQTYNGCLGILRLTRAYGPLRLEAACKRALAGSSYSYRTLHNILVNNLDKLEAPDQAALFTMPEHGNLRGPQAYN